MLGRAWAGPGPVLGLGRSWVYKMAQLEPVYTIKPSLGPRYFTAGPGRAGLGWPGPLDISRLLLGGWDIP